MPEQCGGTRVIGELSVEGDAPLRPLYGRPHVKQALPRDVGDLLLERRSDPRQQLRHVPDLHGEAGRNRRPQPALKLGPLRNRCPVEHDREALSAAPGRARLAVLAPQARDEVGGRVGELVFDEERRCPRRLDPDVGGGVTP
jgi:hypothetical protein